MSSIDGMDGTITKLIMETKALNSPPATPRLGDSQPSALHMSPGIQMLQWSTHLLVCLLLAVRLDSRTLCKPFRDMQDVIHSER